MKPSSCFKRLGIGVIALSAAIVLQQPSHANQPKVTVTTTPGDSSSVVVPTVGGTPTPGSTIVPGSANFPPGSVICVPEGPTPCAQSMPQPIVKDSFFCQTGGEAPTTYVNTPSGNIPLIRWVSRYFKHSGYSPDVRCQEVSQRFNQYYNQGVLNYVTTGYMNDLPVICVASEIGGPCTGTLFTLKPGEDASRVVQQLFDVRAGASGPLYENQERIYVDMRPYTQAIQANR